MTVRFVLFTGHSSFSRVNSEESNLMALHQSVLTCHFWFVPQVSYSSLSTIISILLLPASYVKTYFVLTKYIQFFLSLSFPKVKVLICREKRGSDSRAVVAIKWTESNWTAFHYRKCCVSFFLDQLITRKDFY